jgi:hypothetical protein
MRTQHRSKQHLHSITFVGKAYPTPWRRMLSAMNSRRYLMRYSPTSLLMTSPNNSQRSPLNCLS